MSVQVVSFRCILKNQLGQVISSTYNQNILTSTQGESGTLEALAEALQDLKKGEKRKVHLRAEQAYGYYIPDLVIMRSLEDLDIVEPLKLGETIIYAHKGKRTHFRVTEISDEFVTLDGNHPLAGQDLIFEIEATEAREATLDEIQDVASMEGPFMVH